MIGRIVGIQRSRIQISCHSRESGNPEGMIFIKVSVVKETRFLPPQE